NVLTAPVTLAGQSIGNGYSMGGQSPDTFVRVDVTYLRQDFSLPQGKTRFDYFVRTRSLSTQEAADFEAQIAKRGPPPSHLAAQRALREITGQTPANATPEAWRHLLKSISAEGTCDHQDSNFGFRFCETGNSLPE
ncbi:MAG: hypothetical protein HY289_11040, partial [Planctomycetes bacterium]|nr:hypothetical protein [Planctomycetota bacterium]